MNVANAQRVSPANGEPDRKPIVEPEWRSPDMNLAWGRSESIDPDNVGDIADEGAGHRG
jgi:hypothetical protein